MRSAITGLVGWCSAALALTAPACSFDPVVRPVQPEQVDTEPAQLLGRLDERGHYILLGRVDESGAPRVSISRWEKREQCELPPGPSSLLASPSARTAGHDGPVLYAPAGVARGEGEIELVLVDERCRVYAGYGLVKDNSVRTFSSRFEERAFFTYRDSEDTLFVLDPYVSLTARAVAADVRSVRTGVGGPRLRKDALWLIEAGRLTQRGLDGERFVSLGRDVSAMVVHGSAQRVAFVDQGALYEAIAPAFAARRLADDGCAPRYSGDNLEFFAPCESQALVRIRISSGNVRTFDEGVFASSEQDGVQLDYAHTPDAEAQLIARFGSGQRLPVIPSFDAGKVYVLDDERLAGLDAERRFGVWDRASQGFTALFSGVEEVVAHHRGRVHTYAWLLHHDADEAGLGALSVLQEDGMRSLELARGVPRSEHGGFLVERGTELPNYPFSTPLVVLLEQAQRISEQPERFRGRLRALAMGGEPSLALAEDVSSYLLVAAPVPGVLYAVDVGADRGLWFVAL